ncbi:MAG: pyridoxal phosphate-dependent aminotransferase [Tissierellales bacterium]|jgi:cystathionine beta-lyase|nr:pyridoxal phosphate-dependent aminotransferase [Tissierellales bacterium]
MRYDFSKPINRANTHSLKWDGIKEKFGINPEGILPLWVADMDFKSPIEVADMLKHKASHGIYGYSGDFEDYEDSVIRWMKNRHGWDIDRGWIAYTPGIVTGLNLLVSALTKPGDKIIVQPPVYTPFYEAINNHGCEVVENPLIKNGDRYEMDFENLESQMSENVKLLILCSPHNPVGRVWTREELTRLGEICEKHGVIVISDEIHGDLIYKKSKHTPFAMLGESFAQNTVICTAPSKTFNVAGLNTANLIIPNEKLRKAYLDKRASFGISRPNVFGFEALEAAYTFGEEWLEQLLVYLEGNADFVKSYIDENLPQIKVSKPDGTYLMWLDFRGMPVKGKELEDFLIREAKVLMNQGDCYGTGGDGFVRLNIGCARVVLEDALERIKVAVEKLN